MKERKKMKPAISVLFMCALLACQAGEIILGVNGKTKHEIVVPDQFRDESAKISVTRSAELIRQRFAAAGIDIRIVSESGKNPDMHGIFLGETKFAGRSGVDVKTFSGWQHIHKTVGKNIIIAGNDRNDPVAVRYSPWDVAAGKEKKLRERPYYATLHSTAEFLYRYAGARFLKPGDEGMEFLPQSVIRVPDRLDEVMEPWARENRFGREGDDLFTVANHCGMFQSVWWGGGHQHWQALVPEKHFKSHPEYFTLINGLRTVAGRRGHPCLSNPEVRELIYKHILDQCDAGYDIVQVGQNDGFTPCQCAKCAEMYGIRPKAVPSDGIGWLMDPAWGEKIWRIHLEFAKRLEKDRPGKKLMLVAYGPCTLPPAGVEFPENVIVEIIAPSSLENFSIWRKVKVPGGFGALLYIWGNYQVPGYTPLRNISYVRALGECFVKNNVRILDLDGRPLLEYGLEGPNIYAYLRLALYPNLKNAAELFNEYIDSAFLESSVPMKRFFAELQKTAEYWTLVGDHIVRTDRDPIRALGIMYTPEIIHRLESELSAAERTARCGNVKKRLASVRMEFNFLKDIINVIYAWHQFNRVRDAASFGALLDAVETRNENLRKNGQDNLITNGRYMGISPFNWDVPEMRRQGVSALADKSMEAFYSPVGLTFDSKGWDSVRPVMLGPVVGDDKALETDTSFKVMYDSRNLYIRVTGRQKAPLKTFKARGRDAEIWLAESIIFQISPTGDRSRYYYFSFDSVQNSFADAEHGFITDDLDPRYGWNDWNWNADWTFETRIRDNVWESMAVIPFKSIRTEMPGASEVWAFNIGRVHFRADGKREFSAWNRNINKSFIPGDAFFGNLIFKKEKAQ